jgi:hypothetical protein
MQRIYVKGTVRKDAVEITPKEVAITEAMILEQIYGEAWVPTSVRTVEVDNVPSPAQELERLNRAYDHEAVAKAFGAGDATARQAITAVMKLDSAQAAIDSGVIPVAEGASLTITQTPEKGTKTYARQVAANAHPDDLQPVITGDDPNANAATAKAQADAQQAEDDRRKAEQDAADQRRQEIADEAASLKSSNADISADNATKAEMQAELDKRGVEYPASATKADLQELLDANPAKTQDDPPQG